MHTLAGMSTPAEPAATTGSRVVTLPNVISVVRLALVPVFLWLLFGQDSRVGAAVLLGGLGATDWVDGWIARRFGQVSELGKVLDPTADRLMLVVAVVAIHVDGSVPAVVFWPVVVREVAVSLAVLALALAGAERMEVLWVGKAGAFALMFAFPFFLLAAADTGLDGLWLAVAWICAVPGVLLSYQAVVDYARRLPGALAGRPGRRSEEARR